MEIIDEIFESFKFYNPDNGYAILLLESGNVAVGHTTELTPGDRIELHGNWVTHPKYGEQFKFEYFELRYPDTKISIINYLSSGLIKGIGEATAINIYRKFGDKTFDILDNEIFRLREVEGIGEKKLATIASSWEEQKSSKDILLYLQQNGFSINFAIRIFTKYKYDTISIVKNNPYQIIKDIWGLGFKTIDKAALKMGFSPTDKKRLAAGIEYTLSVAANDGHVFLPENILYEKCVKELGVEINDGNAIQDLMNKNILIKKGKNIYLKYLYFYERTIEEFFRLKLKNKNKFNTSALRLSGITFSEEQINAIKGAIQNKSTVITGGPGTGKTTIVQGIIEVFKQMEKSIALCAPTGRAAKRLSEVTNMPAQTIHRLLEYDPFEESFVRNADNQLTYDLIIVDEVSMIDTVLFFHLLTAINENSQIVLIGDAQQIPSIGPGNILHDLIEHSDLQIFELKQNFRQSENSKIIDTAYSVISGKSPELNLNPESDFFFIRKSDTKEIPNNILELLSERIPNKYQLDPLNDIQIIAPMYKGECGVNNLNREIQSGFNFEKVVLKIGLKEFRINDKVMQLRNNYEKDIFNGDIGIVVYPPKNDKALYVSFNGKIVKYETSELDELTLAYAITVHKSQGSEYPCVIMPLVNEHFIMLQRNLLYTAITRAQQLLIIIGTEQALNRAIQNNFVKKRFTSLFHLEDL